MASFFSRLFGAGSNKPDTAPVQSDPVSYLDLTIVPGPIKADGQWRLAGVIIKDTPDGKLQRDFLRADTFSTSGEAEEFAIRKGKQIIDEQGDRLFANGEPEGRT